MKTLVRYVRSRCMDMTAAIVIGAFFAFLAGCGGGTSGTGGTGNPGRTLVEGVLVDSGSVPVAGATLTVLETGDFAVTDAAGWFEIETDLSDTSAATLLLETDSVQATAAIEAIAQSTVRISLELVLDVPQSQLTIRDREDVVATPPPAPSPTQMVQPTAVGEPTDVAPTATVPVPQITATVPAEAPMPEEPETAATPTAAPTATAPGTVTTGSEVTHRFWGVLRSSPAHLSARAFIRITAGDFVPVRADGGFQFEGAVRNGRTMIGVRVGEAEATAPLQDLPDTTSRIRVTLNLRETALGLELQVATLGIESPEGASEQPRSRIE